MDLGLFLFSCNDLQINDLRQNQPSTAYKGILKAICDLSDLTGWALMRFVKKSLYRDVSVYFNDSIDLVLTNRVISVPSDLQLCWKKTHRCFPTNFLTFLRTTVL